MPLRKPPAPAERGQKTYSRAPLTSYYRSKNQPGSASPFKKKPAKHPGRKILFRAADIVLIVLLLAGLIYSLLLKPQPRVAVNDLSYHSQAVYDSQISPLFGGFKNGNKITFDESSTAAAIRKKFPEVQNVRIELPFFSEKPTVWLDISPPAFKLQSSSGIYIVDSQGLAVAGAADLPELKDLVTLIDKSDYPAMVGRQMLSSQAVDFINTVIAQVRHNKVPISSLTLPAVVQEMDLRTADQPYFVKFYLGGNAEVQTGQFLASRQKFIQTKQPPSQYLDVRVEGKIFYK
jgi:hypothetical protein